LAPQSDAIVMATIVAGAVAASAIDLRTRRVPNVLNALLASIGVAFAVSGVSGLTVGASLAGIGVGLALMMPGHLFGGTGAGDVKLLAAMGSLIGPAHTVSAFLYSAVAGGAIALAVAVHRRRLQQTLGGTARLITTAASNAADIARPHENNRFAYAPAIAVGTLIAALGR
jgi:prepilin peptidase CpaA